MTRYDVCELLAEAYRNAQRIKSGERVLQLNSSQRRAVNLLLDVLRARAGVPLGGVQGPPGTGKTTVIEGFVYDYISDELYKMDGLIVYVAPTNHLAAQAFERVAAALLARDYTLNDITDLMRLYGSRVTVRECSRVFERNGLGDISPPSSANRIVYDYVDPDRVKIVFTTEYQRVSGKFTHKPSRIYLIVDEASKSPYYRAFISIADSMMRYEDFPHTLVALGDPEQAITIPEAFRIRRVPLLMPKIKRLLEEHGHSDRYIMLDTTYRLPRPSEEPISHGFYDGRLRAYEPATFRLREVAEMFTDLRERAERLIRENIAWSTRIERIFEAVYEAVVNHVPIVIIRTGMFRGSAIASTYDRARTNLGIITSLVLEAFMTEAENTGSYSIPSIMVTAPYSDMVTNVSFNYRQRFGGIVKQPRVATVHAVIGGEADFVVTMLGKEYSGRVRDYSWAAEDVYRTMYFNEPQVLNVQLSRHHKLLVVIGAVDRLASHDVRHYIGRRVGGTARKLLELVEEGRAVQVRNLD